MKDVIDAVESSYLEPVFTDWFNALQRAKYIENYRFLNDHYLIAFDGSEYFNSEKICCPGCLKKESSRGVN